MQKSPKESIGKKKTLKTNKSLAKSQDTRLIIYIDIPM